MAKLILAGIGIILLSFIARLNASDFGAELRNIKIDTATIKSVQDNAEKIKKEYNDYKVSKGKECNTAVSADKSAKTGEPKQVCSTDTHKTCSLSDRLCQTTVSTDTAKANAQKAKTKKKAKTSKKTATKKIATPLTGLVK